MTGRHTNALQGCESSTGETLARQLAAPYGGQMGLYCARAQQTPFHRIARNRVASQRTLNCVDAIIQTTISAVDQRCSNSPEIPAQQISLFDSIVKTIFK